MVARFSHCKYLSRILRKCLKGFSEVSPPQNLGYKPWAYTILGGLMSAGGGGVGTGVLGAFKRYSKASSSCCCWDRSLAMNRLVNRLHIILREFFGNVLI